MQSAPGFAGTEEMTGEFAGIAAGDPALRLLRLEDEVSRLRYLVAEREEASA